MSLQFAPEIQLQPAEQHIKNKAEESAEAFRRSMKNADDAHREMQTSMDRFEKIFNLLLSSYVAQREKYEALLIERNGRI